jgi:hypothetical protein
MCFRVGRNISEFDIPGVSSELSLLVCLVTIDYLKNYPALNKHPTENTS